MSTDTATNQTKTDQAKTEQATGLRDYHYPHVYRQLLGYVQGHEMTVLHEDGLYRHLRFATPGTGIGRFDIITWPGYLTIVGDIGNGWTFVRERDMFDWFTDGGRVPAGHINPGYWSEKVAGTRRDYKGYQEEKFRAHVNGLVEEAITGRSLTDADAALLRSDVEMEVLCDSYDQTLAYQALAGFTFHPADDATSEFSLTYDVDPENWDDFDHHFLLACHAILWGIRHYYREGHR